MTSGVEMPQPSAFAAAWRIVQRVISKLGALQVWIDRHPGLARRLLFAVAAAAIILRIITVISPAEMPPQEDARAALGMLHKVGVPADAAPPPVLNERSHVLPGFPLVLAAVAGLDPTTRDAVRCAAGAGPCVGTKPFGLYVLQALLALTTLWLFFAAALSLSGSRDVAMLTAALLVMAIPLGEPAGFPKAYVYPTLFLAAYAALAAGTRGRLSPLRHAASGATLAIAACSALCCSSPFLSPRRRLCSFRAAGRRFPDAS